MRSKIIYLLLCILFLSCISYAEEKTIGVIALNTSRTLLPPDTMNDRLDAKDARIRLMDYITDYPAVDVILTPQNFVNITLNITCNQRQNCALDQEEPNITLLMDHANLTDTYIFLAVTNLTDGTSNSSGIILINKSGLIQTYFLNQTNEPFDVIYIYNEMNDSFRSACAVGSGITLAENALADENLDLFFWSAEDSEDSFTSCLDHMILDPSNHQYDCSPYMCDDIIDRHGFFIKSNSKHDEGCIFNLNGSNIYEGLAIEKNFTFVNITIDCTAPAWYSNITHPSTPVTYDQEESYQFNVTWNDSRLDTVWIENDFGSSLHNDSITGNDDSVYYFELPWLAAGSYVWRMYANDTVGNLNYTAQFEYVVEKANPLINLTINGTQSNLSINQTWGLNITANISLGDTDYLELFIDGSLINNGTSPISNNSYFDYTGTYNITVIYNGTENYSRATKTYWIEVNDTCNWPEDSNWTINGTQRLVCKNKNITLDRFLILEDNASLILENSTLNFTQNSISYIKTNNTASLIINQSSVNCPVSIISSHNLSNISLYNLRNDSDCSEYFDTEDNSSLLLWNASSIESVILADHSTAYINFSELGYLGLEGESNLYMDNSSIDEHLEFSQAAGTNITFSNLYPNHGNFSGNAINNAFGYSITDSNIGGFEMTIDNDSDVFVNYSVFQDIYDASYDSNLTFLEVNVTNCTLYGHSNYSLINLSFDENLRLGQHANTTIIGLLGKSDSILALEDYSNSTFMYENIIDKLKISIANDAFFSGNLSILDKDITWEGNHSTVIRQFPIYVYHQDGSPADTDINITYNGTILFSGSSEQGIAHIDVLFNVSSYNKTFNITIDGYTRGNLSLSKDTPFNITYDNTSPIITFSSPVNGSAIAASEITLNISTDDQTYCSYILDSENITSIDGLLYNHSADITGLSDSVHNLTINCTNNYGLNSSARINFTVDTISPQINITYPSSLDVIHNTFLNFSYLLNDSNLDSAWLILDHNTTKIFLNSSADEVNDNKSIDFKYPGKHLLKVYANDTAGNVAISELNIFSNSTLNSDSWTEELNNSNPSIGSVELLSDGSAVTGQVPYSGNLTIAINMSDIQIKIVNVSVRESLWSFLFNATDNDPYFTSILVLEYGTNSSDYISLTSMSDFLPAEDYFGIVTLNMSPGNYSSIYYCPDDALQNCAAIGECSGNYSKASTSACYNESGNQTRVYVPHFSAVFGANDTISSNITILSPADDEMLRTSYENTLNFTTNEETTCEYRLNSSVNYTLIEGEDNTFYHLFDGGVSDVWNLTYYTMTIRCNDSAGNSAQASVHFSVNDTDAPVFELKRGADGILAIILDEPSLCKYSAANVDFENMSYFDSNYALEHEKEVDPDERYYIRCRDASSHQNEAYTNILVSDDESSTSSGSGSYSGGSSPPPATETTNAWDSMTTGTKNMYISGVDISITQLMFDILHEIDHSVTIKVEKVTTLPTDYPALSGEIYELIRISKIQLLDSDMSDILIRFRVSKSWIKDNSIDPDSIKLYHYVDGWESLPTRKTDEDSSYLHFESDTPSFSYFGISGIKKEGNDENDNSVDDDNLSDEDNDPVDAQEQTSSEEDQSQNESLTDSDEKPENKDNKSPIGLIIGILVLLIALSLIAFFIYQKRYSVLTDDDLSEIKAYVQECKEEGISFEVIRSTLLKVGWEEHLIDLVIHDVHLPTEEIESLVKYMNYSLAKGFTREEIKKSLESVGWQEEVIENAFSYVE